MWSVTKGKWAVPAGFSQRVCNRRDFQSTIWMEGQYRQYCCCSIGSGSHQHMKRYRVECRRIQKSLLFSRTQGGSSLSKYHTSSALLRWRYEAEVLGSRSRALLIILSGYLQFSSSRAFFFLCSSLYQYWIKNRFHNTVQYWNKEHISQEYTNIESRNRFHYKIAYPALQVVGEGKRGTSDTDKKKTLACPPQPQAQQKTLLQCRKTQQKALLTLLLYS